MTSSRLQIRNYYALANLKLFKLLYKPLPNLPKTYLNVKEPEVSANLSPRQADKFDTFVDHFIEMNVKEWQGKSKIIYGSLRLRNQLTDKESNLEERHKIDWDHEDLLKLAKNGDFHTVIQVLESPSCGPPVGFELLEQLALVFATVGCVKGVEEMEQMAEKRVIDRDKPFFYAQHVTALRQRGENMKALRVCEEIYDRHPNLRRDVRKYLTHLLIDIVGNHSDAALVKGHDLVTRLTVQYKDCRPAAALWHACFLSEWFSDQQVASKLLKFIIKEGSLLAMERRLLVATYTALANNRPELVHGLLEDLLSLDMHHHLPLILQALFDYKCSRRDLKGCSAILKTSLELNIALTSKQHARLLDLLCDRRSALDRWLPKPGSKPKSQVKVHTPAPFQFKF